jgi:hypothetical protein
MPMTLCLTKRHALGNDESHGLSYKKAVQPESTRIHMCKAIGKGNNVFATFHLALRESFERAELIHVPWQHCVTGNYSTHTVESLTTL